MSVLIVVFWLCVVTNFPQESTATICGVDDEAEGPSEVLVTHL
jgi:hypothetical protein